MKNILIALSLLLQPNLNKDDFEKSYYDSMVYNGATRGVEQAFESSLIIESMSAKTGGVSLGSGNLIKIGKHEVVFTAYHVVEDSIFAMAVAMSYGYQLTLMLGVLTYFMAFLTFFYLGNLKK